MTASHALRPVLLRATRPAKDGRPPLDLGLPVPVGPALRLGREARPPAGTPAHDSDFGADLVVPGDNFVSNNHATVRWDGTRLAVVKRAGVRNPILLYDADRPDAPPEAREEFAAALFDRFRIGDTVFEVRPEPEPAAERTIGGAELDAVSFDAPAERLAALAGLPDVILNEPDDAELADRLLLVLLRGAARADWAAVVGLDAAGEVQVTAARRRDGTPADDIRPSRKLVASALREFRNRVHVAPTEPAGADHSDAFTVSGLTWAMCVGLSGSREEGLYLGGSGLADPHELARDLKFATLAGDIFAGLRDKLALKRQMNVFETLVSAAVRRALRDRPLEEVLAPKEYTVTVLFCDLRGFTRAVAAGEADLMGTWDRLAEALDAMTDAVTSTDGVIGDFQGDAVMGFWGWPHPQPDQIDRAAKAALRIRREFYKFAQKPTHPLHGTACGIGLATGPAIAGKLGTIDQTKIGVFGPVVNRAARLEAATKKLCVPLLVDGGVADGLATAGYCRVRKVAPVRPKGLPAPVLISELLPLVGEAGCGLSEEHRRKYEAALRRFQAGDWGGFLEGARGMPADGPTEFVTRHVLAGRGLDGRAPAGWDGGIPLDADDRGPAPPVPKGTLVLGG